MAKKVGKLMVIGLVAGAAAAGVYHYMQNKDKNAQDFDDFDDFDEDPLETEEKKDFRKYVSLDSAKALVNDTFEKAKDTISKVSKKITNSGETNDEDIDFLDDEEDLFDENFFDESGAEDKSAETVEADEPAVEEAASAEDKADDSSEEVEEFFDDEEESDADKKND